MAPREKGPTKNQYSQGLTYVAQKPSFLQNFGAPPASTSGRPGREALPERPSEGEWAGGSDIEDEDEEDEWSRALGGGGDEGPQVVVLKEGRHLSRDEIERERRRAKGEKTPPPEEIKTKAPKDPSAKTDKEPKRPIIPKPNLNKRKLVGNDPEEDKADDAKKDGVDRKKKKKKAKKGLLSFNEEEEV
ncbi:hypothetical protein I350_04833 [Cryptococcus amylolentus CBS 6273]|uniref:DUF4604 domain-containing protein n=1 Tax=Cryptococcus amylolentus CBS 6273 TaxID=1296118 RepID=A0A1E3K0R9_9TREE|nr:hypothetical protein I350_04833 [Cryptococcus amylolentus CBS 6273]